MIAATPCLRRAILLAIVLSDMVSLAAGSS